jgi:hypothetical protein
MTMFPAAKPLMPPSTSRIATTVTPVGLFFLGFLSFGDFKIFIYLCMIQEVFVKRYINTLNSKIKIARAHLNKRYETHFITNLGTCMLAIQATQTEKEGQ